MCHTLLWVRVVTRLHSSVRRSLAWVVTLERARNVWNKEIWASG